MQTEARLLLALGVDGLITDAPEIAVAARAELYTSRSSRTAPRSGAVSLVR